MASGPHPSNDEYDFSHRRRGIALIICNEQFQAPDLGYRAAAEEDRKNLMSTFQELGFATEDIRQYVNLSAAGIHKVVSQGELNVMVPYDL